MKLDTKSSLMQRRLAKKAKMIPAELLWTRISVEKNSITKPSLEKELVKKMSMSMKVQPVEGCPAIEEADGHDDDAQPDAVEEGLEDLKSTGI